MPRPVKWSRDVHRIHERAARSRTETWSRQDIERLFEISRPSAQNLMKAIGEVQVVGGTHFVDRASLLGFLQKMVEADSVEEALRLRLEAAAPVTRPAPIRRALPLELRRITLDDLPGNVEVREGEVRVTGPDAESVVEGLLRLAQIMQNDLEAVRRRLDPSPPERQVDEGLREMLLGLRKRISRSYT